MKNLKLILDVIKKYPTVAAQTSGSFQKRAFFQNGTICIGKGPSFNYIFT